MPILCAALKLLPSIPCAPPSRDRSQTSSIGDGGTCGDAKAGTGWAGLFFTNYRGGGGGGWRSNGLSWHKAKSGVRAYAGMPGEVNHWCA